MLHVTLLPLRHPQMCWKVFVGRRDNDTLWSIYLRLYLCSCVLCLCLGKEKISLGGNAKPLFAVKFNSKDTSWPQCVGLWAEILSLLKELNPRAWHCGIFFSSVKNILQGALHNTSSLSYLSSFLLFD